VSNVDKVFKSETTQSSLMAAAERLGASLGTARVSTRDILVAAGQRNQSALQYHFGSKEGLFQEISLRHARSLDARRQAMLRALPEEPTARQLIEALIVPVIEEIASSDTGRHFAACLAQAYAEPGFDLEAFLPRQSATIRQVLNRLHEILPPAGSYKFLLSFDICVFAMYRWACLPDEERSTEDLKETLVRQFGALLVDGKALDSTVNPVAAKV